MSERERADRLGLFYIIRISAHSARWPKLPNVESIGKLLLIVGASLALVGLALILAGRFGLGRLPGDVVIKRDDFALYLPITTMLLVSALLTLVLNLLLRR